MSVADLAQSANPAQAGAAPQNGQPKDWSFTHPAPTNQTRHPWRRPELKLAGESLADLLRRSEDLRRRDRSGGHQSHSPYRSPNNPLFACCLLRRNRHRARASRRAMDGVAETAIHSIAPGTLPRGCLAGPQAPPLAGPSLPPQLLNFDLQNSSLRTKSQTACPLGRSACCWPPSSILGAVSLFQYSAQDPRYEGGLACSPGAATKAGSVPAHAPAVVEEHPAARSVEVAGVRIVTGPNKRPQLQYIVINHSSNELTGLNIRIAVRSVDKLADAPLFSISSMVACSGPNQSKEIHTDLIPPFSLGHSRLAVSAHRSSGSSPIGSGRHRAVR